MPVGSRPPKHRGKHGVLGGNALQDTPDLQLAFALRDVQPLHLHLRRDLCIELIDALAADGLQHLHMDAGELAIPIDKLKGGQILVEAYL